MEWEENLDEIFDLKHILPEIYSSHPLISNHTNKTCDDNSIKKANTKQLLNSISNGAQKIITMKPSSSSSSSCPKLISFVNSKTFDVSTNSEKKNFSEQGQVAIDSNQSLSLRHRSPYIVTPCIATGRYSNSNLDHEMANEDNYSLAPQIINFSSSAENDDFGNYNQIHDDATNERVCISSRTQLQARDHLLAERKRRENLGQLFISLSKIVPGLKKLDKASLLEDAINHLKVLRERVKILEEEIKNKKSSSNNMINGSTCESGGAEINARISNKHVLIKIHCNKQKGLMSRVPCQMEKMNLSVLDMRIMPFGDDALDITLLAEMQREFHGLTVKDIVDHLQTVFFNLQDK